MQRPFLIVCLPIDLHMGFDVPLREMKKGAPLWYMIGFSECPMILIDKRKKCELRVH